MIIGRESVCCDAVNRLKACLPDVQIVLRNFFQEVKREHTVLQSPLTILAVSSSIFVSRTAYVRQSGPLKAPRTVKSTDLVRFWRKDRYTGRLEQDNTSQYRHPRVRFFTRSAKKSFGAMKNGRIHAGQGFCAAQFIQDVSTLNIFGWWNSIEDVMRARFICSSQKIYSARKNNNLFRATRHSFSTYTWIPLIPN